QLETLDVFDRFAKGQPLPTSREELVQKAVRSRPDLLAVKIAVRRAQADLRLARANRYPDLYLLYQPYTFQNNTYLGVPSSYSWTLGLTATVPIFNRNQGNVTRAKVNITQSEIQAASAARGVIRDVMDAAQELEQSLVAVNQFRSEIIPTSQQVRD